MALDQHNRIIVSTLASQMHLISFQTTNFVHRLTRDNRLRSQSSNISDLHTYQLVSIKECNTSNIFNWICQSEKSSIATTHKENQYLNPERINQPEGSGFAIKLRTRLTKFPRLFSNSPVSFACKSPHVNNVSDTWTGQSPEQISVGEIYTFMHAHDE